MRAMILGAGLGTRLRPLTEHWPKPAIPLLGRPLIGYTLGLLKGAGVREVGINTHHLPEVMERVAGAVCERLELSLEISREEVIQGTGGGIRGLRSFLSGGTSVVFNGDVLFALDLPKVLEAHRASGAAASMVLLPMPENENYAAVELDPEGRVRRIAGKGPGGARLSPWHFTGVHVLEPEVFDFMRPDGPEDINREVYVRMLEAGREIRGIVAQGYWSDLGTPSRYLATVRDLLFGQVPGAPFGEVWPLSAEARGQGNFWADGAEGARKVAGPAFFARGSSVAPGALIGSAVSVEGGGRVQDRARLNRAVVFEGTVIAEGEELVETLAWREHRIPAPLGGPVRDESKSM
jgi:mannose-1-phosphate guanylyltransferase